MTPTLLEPLARAIFNVSYGGRSIDAFTFGKKYTHYYDNTSEVAKKFASKLHAKFPGIDISPITLEYLFKSYLGRYGNAIAMADDAATPGVWSGMGNALAYFAKQPYFSAIPTGFQTQMYQDFKGYYKNIEGDLSAVKAGKLKVSNDMINDLFDLENVHKVLGKVTDPNDIFALSIYGMQIYETYVKDAAAFKP
jgi:hypothetical protein